MWEIIIKTHRVAWVDNAKGIGILLIMIGHLNDLPIIMESILYAFHVPLFFFISGYLFNKDLIYSDHIQYFKRYIKRLIVPFISFSLFSYLLWIFKKDITNETLDSLIIFKGLIIGLGDYMPYNVALWFFTCLFSIYIYVYFIYKYNFIQYKLTILFIFLLSLILYLISLKYGRITIWNLDSALLGVVIFIIGYKFRESHFDVNKYYYILLTLSTFLLLTVALINGKSDFNHFRFGNIFLYLLGVFSGTLLVYLISEKIKTNKYLTFISKNSIIFFGLHLVIFRTVDFLSLKFKLQMYIEDYFILYNFFYILFSIVCLTIVSLMINKYFSFLTGVKK